MTDDDPLSLRRTDPDLESFVTLYEHPDFGKIDVGRISRRAGSPHQADSWSWNIRCSTLAPVWSPDDTSIPSAERRWIRRPNISFEGTARSREEAIAAWKEKWPDFRDARTADEWRQVKADQDRSRKAIMIFDALKMRLTESQRAELERERGRDGPAPDWLEKLLLKNTDDISRA